MITLSFGFKKPQTGDKQFWVWLEDNIQQLNDHTHNGTNSAKITSASVTATTQAISAAGWAVSGTGYRQLVTMPVGLNYDEYIMVFRESVSREQMFLGVEKVSATSYYVYCNDNTLDIIAYYVS